MLRGIEALQERVSSPNEERLAAKQVEPAVQLPVDIDVGTAPARVKTLYTQHRCCRRPTRTLIPGIYKPRGGRDILAVVQLGEQVDFEHTHPASYPCAEASVELSSRMP